MTFIEKLDLLRRARGYSERSLASELGINPSAISRWRSRNSIPRPEIVKKAADIFGLTTDVLLDKTKPLPHQAVYADIHSAATRAKKLFPDNPDAGQAAFELFTGQRSAKLEKAEMADFLRERAKTLRKIAAELERKAEVLES